MKNVLIFILLAIIAALAWWILQHPPEEESPIERQAKENVKLEAERVSSQVDKKGLEHTIFEETKRALTQAGLALSTDSAGMIDSVLRLLNEERGAKNRVLEIYTQATAEIKRLNKVMAETDTSFYYKDDWLTVDVIKPLGGKPATLNSTYNMELNWMWYNERKNLFSRRRTYGRFWPNDPNATIMGLKHFRVESPQDKLKISIQAIGDYHPRIGAGLGGGARIQAGRIGLQGAYLWDGHRWYPAFRGSYDLIAW
ncbi:hypothetical protein [Parapedobacter lycopersici]|uniref:hypothetical protein n=1 Tax=Parapedobacter lycopersici TaxID=1864939 RepID=UPI00214D2112|nr:hypothetical protein [Parapedobacter lycopersici]